MPVILKLVKPVHMSYECDDCHLGKMVFTGQQIPPQAQGQAPKFVHICDKCGNGKGLETQYPRINYVDPDEEVKEGAQIVLAKA